MPLQPLLHRHIGGLEITIYNDVYSGVLHRHIGGLENLKCDTNHHIKLHRHIGGLEIVIGWV